MCVGEYIHVQACGRAQVYMDVHINASRWILRLGHSLKPRACHLPRWSD